ncbi:GNAT family N-acetyltransferase [Cronobacter dublinensis]|uniref:GNAT family N-acetyltransferase n=1 Tax=Cronobacter dublinensis TaxID=413497 RepID=UPI003517AA4D
MRDLHLRFRAANSPETSADELKSLSLDENEMVRASVVHNPCKPVSSIEILFNDKSDHVQEALTMNGFPTSPDIIQCKSIAGKNIILRNAHPDDAEFIVKIRTDAKKGRFISSTSSDVDKQRQWLESYLKSTGQAYFVITDMEGNSLGTVRLYDQQGDSFCWGSWVIADSAPSNTAIESALLVYYYALKIGFTRSHFDVRKGNSSVIKFHERFGAKRTGETELDVLFEITKEDIENSLTKYKKYLPDNVKVEF